MSGRAYTALGWLVWHGARWYVRRRYPNARRVTIALAVAAGIGVALAAGRER